MRMGNLNGRAVLLSESGYADLEEVSNGRFSAEPQQVFEDWTAIQNWFDDQPKLTWKSYEAASLGAPVPSPRQIFAIGLNYSDHAVEAGLDVPSDLVVFTKFQSALAGPYENVTYSGPTLDFEAELVVVVGKTLHKVTRAEAATGIAGLTVGQDFSDRTVQSRPPSPQFSLGKSFPGFGPTGPAVVTLDEFEDPSSLDIQCWIEGPTATAQDTDRWVVQDSNTNQMIFDAVEIITRLSAVVTLQPGDLIFTGTPAGVGLGRGTYLSPGDTVTTRIEGIGEIRNEIV